MKAVALLIVLFAAAFASLDIASLHDQFIQFQHKYNRLYSSQEEYNYRFNIFVENMKRADKLTQQNHGSATFGVNVFADLSPEEFRTKYLNPTVGNRTEWATLASSVPVKTSFPSTDLSHLGVGAPNPSNYNWYSAGVCTPIYNQAQCGSCWAFSATETIESYFALAGHGLHSLSMEQVVQCDTTCYGCQGGWTLQAYAYVKGAGGIEPYQDYPYTSGGGITGKCHFHRRRAEATVTGYQQLNGEPGIYHQASSAGPVSVCVDASTWQYYTGGVLTSCPDQIDHCVQVVGYANYGTSNSYWIVRNSWGTSWGLSGFIYIQTGQNLCAIGDMATICSATTAAH